MKNFPREFKNCIDEITIMEKTNEVDQMLNGFLYNFTNKYEHKYEVKNEN